MAKGSFVGVVALALLAAMVLLTAEAAFDCGKARGQLAPCAPYLTGNAPAPSVICCKGVQYIKDNTVNKDDMQAACQCLKDTATAITSLEDSAAQQLPEQCLITINVPISKTVNCSAFQPRASTSRPTSPSFLNALHKYGLPVLILLLVACLTTLSLIKFYQAKKIGRKTMKFTYRHGHVDPQLAAILNKIVEIRTESQRQSITDFSDECLNFGVEEIWKGLDLDAKEDV